MPRRLLGPWRTASGLRSEWVTPRPAIIQFSYGNDTNPWVRALVAALAPFGRIVAYGIAGREQNELARDAYSLLHFPMVAGIVLDVRHSPEELIDEAVERVRP